MTLIWHDILCTKKEKFARHLKKICKRFEIYTGTGSDGTCTGTDDTGTGTEGTDSTSTGAYDSGTILSHFH